VFRVVQTHQGSISAEHGIGRDKRHRLGWVRSGHEIAAMEAVKRALDPSGLFNPGVLLPATA
jgi:FAD/FMN-containing dehydrogenase